MAPDIVPDTYTIYPLCNNKDALIGVNQQVLFYWYFDGNGTLQNALTYSTGRFVENGIFWPSMQPGTYDLTLFLATTGKWWNFDHWVSMVHDEYTNTITVKETLSLLIDIKDDTAYIRTATNTIISKLDQLSATITRIDGNVLTINTTVGSIKATLDQLSPVITRIDGNVATINTVAGSINTTLNTLSPVITRIDGNVVTINTVAGSINTTLNTLSPVITRIDGNVVTINSTLGPMSTTLDAINATINSIDWTGLAAMNTTLGNISGNVTEIRGNVVSIKANTDTIPGISSSVTSIKANTDTIPAVKTNADNIPGLTTPIYIAVVLSLIAAIAAIAGAFLIYRKTA
jgi:methyl-accepting chemotaxis protein